MIDDALRQSLRQPDALGRAAPVVNPKPAPAPVEPTPTPTFAAAPAPAAPAEMSLNNMSDSDLDIAISRGRTSDDQETIRRGLDAASIAEGRAGQKLSAEQDKKTLEEKAKKAEIDKDFAARQKDLTEKQQKILDSEHGHFAPSKETAGDIAGIFSIMTLATMGSGTVGKYHGMNALASLTGAMKGYKEGRDDLYKKEMDSYNKSLAEYTKHQESLLKQVELSQRLLSTDKDAAMSAAQVAIAMDTGGIASLKMRQGNYKEAIKILDHNLETARKAKRDADSLQERKREAEKKEGFAERRINISLDRQDAKSELMTGADGLLYRVVGNKLEKIEGDTKGMTRLGGAGKTGGGAAQQTAMNVMKQDVGNAAYNLEELKYASEKTGRLPGGSVAFANAFKGDLTSDIIRYATTQTVDAGLQGNDALMLNLAFDIASAQSGGRGQLSDAKVRAVLSQMPLDDQPEDTKKKKWAALFQRFDEANKVLPQESRYPEEQLKALRNYFQPSRSEIKTYKTSQEAKAAQDAGTLKDGEKVIIGGKSGTWHKE
jgi:hypothetical protein